MYVRIGNESKKIDRRYLEKMGAGTKASDDKTIGQFGSGACYAPISAMRMGLEYVVTSFDDDGPYTLRYVAKETDGLNEVFYSYDGVLKPSSFTAEAGQIGWDKHWNIFREAMSNAIDAFYSDGFKYSVDVVDYISPAQEGRTCVYITASPEILDIAKNIDEWFYINKTTFCEGKTYYLGDFKVYNKTDNKGKIFHKGVFIAKNTDPEPQIFDYDFQKIELTEERGLKNSSGLSYKIPEVVRAFDSEYAIRKVIVCATDGKEYSELLHPDVYYNGTLSAPQLWEDCWTDMYGDKAVPVPATTRAEVITNIKLYGYTTVVCAASVIQILRSSGVATVDKVLDEKDFYQVVTPSKECAKVLKDALSICKSFDLPIDRYPIDVFVPNDGVNGAWGVYLTKDKRILISESALEAGLERTVGTLVHEFDHGTSGLGDGDHEFRQVADTKIAKLMIAGAAKRVKVSL